MRTNGKYITDQKNPGFRILFTINLRYEIRQDLVTNLIEFKKTSSFDRDEEVAWD